MTNNHYTGYAKQNIYKLTFNFKQLFYYLASPTTRLDSKNQLFDWFRAVFNSQIFFIGSEQCLMVIIYGQYSLQVIMYIIIIEVKNV